MIEWLEQHHWPGKIGKTPLVRLSSLFPETEGVRAYAKLECMNPTGSAKDRPAWRILKHAWLSGEIGPGSVVVESSSGNMAISMAAICSKLGLRFICVLDPRTSTINMSVMKAYGAEISYVDEPDPETGEFLPARLKRVQLLLKSVPRSFWPNQYANENNVLAHAEGTMPEIAAQLGHVDYVFGGVSTCGTMLGCSRYIRESGFATRTVAVDAAGSVIFGGPKGHRRFPGLGAGIVPPFGSDAFMDYAVTITDVEMANGSRMLLDREAIMAGPSSGAVIAAMRKLAPELPRGSVCVGIIHDRGERYLDTVFDDGWMEKQFGRAWRIQDTEPDRTAEFKAPPSSEGNKDEAAYAGGEQKHVISG